MISLYSRYLCIHVHDLKGIRKIDKSYLCKIYLLMFYSINLYTYIYIIYKKLLLVRSSVCDSTVFILFQTDRSYSKHNLDSDKGNRTILQKYYPLEALIISKLKDMVRPDLTHITALKPSKYVVRSTVDISSNRF